MSEVSIKFAWDEIKEHKKIYGVVVGVIGLTMATFMIANGYNTYTQEIVSGVFHDLFTADAMVVDPDMTIRGTIGAQDTLENAQEIENAINNIPGYNASKRLSCQGSFQVGEGYDGCVLWGIDIGNDVLEEKIRSKLVDGEWFEQNTDYLRHHKPITVSGKGGGQSAGVQSELPTDTPYPIVPGITLKANHKLDIGDTLQLTLTTSREGTNVALITVQIIGFYTCPVPTMDTLMWFMPADCLREIKGYGNETGTILDTVTGTLYFEVNKSMGDCVIVQAPEPPHRFLPHIYAEKVKSEVAGAVDDVGDYNVYSGMDIVRYGAGTLGDVFNIVIVAIMGVVLLLAGMSMNHVMDNIVLRKTREIGSLKAFGARDRVILNIFLYQGLIIGGMAGSAGIGLASLAMSVINWYGVSIGFIAGVELEVKFAITLFTVLVTFILPIAVGILASFHPAMKAARLSPVEALRKGEMAL